MIDIKNLTDGPKIVNGKPPFVLQPGEDREDVAISAAELRAAEATGYFEIHGDADDGAPIDGGDAVNAAVEAARREIVEQAEAKFRDLEASHADQLKAANDRADAADDQVVELRAKIDDLEKDAAARGPDPELIKAAIEGLDPKNDEHWTKAGLPEVKAVEAALGADVTRAQIEAAAPDAKRPAAQ